MKKLSLTKLATAISVSIAVGFSSAAHAETWKYSIEVSQGDIQDLYAKEFKRLIEERTGGDVTVQIFYGGTLGSSADTTELVGNGALQFANASVGHLGASVPSIQLFSIPFLLSDNHEVTKKLLTESTSAYQGMHEDFSRNGLRLLSVYTEGEDAWATKTPVYSPEDLDNLKMRTLVSPLQVDSMRHLGASPTPMPYGEMYGALQMGIIGGVAQPISSLYRGKFFEVTDSITSVRHQPFLSTIITNEVWFDSLPAERQELIQDTVTEVSLKMIDDIPELEAEFLEMILADKPEMNHIQLNEEQRNKFRERSMASRERFVDLVGDSAQTMLDEFLAEREKLESEIN